ncbi:hypothetical protein AAFC00_000297 [Neodothiora populina]|uniref:Pre-mRNA-splicing factor 18 n=1 Tax=Neodothiora populina TaxID=2781224 RepID=A0ABR3PCF2_9PEZI
MDFAALMSAQIAKAKKPATAASTSTTPVPPNKDSTTTTTTSKYLKRADVERQRQEAYEAEQAALEEARLAKVAKKRKHEDEEAERNRVREEKRRRLAEESKKLRQEDEEAEERARRKRLGLPELPPKKTNGEGDDTPDAEGHEAQQDIDEDTLLQNLRDLDEPARLFGETHTTRLRRYRRILARNKKAAAEAAIVMTNGPIPTTLVPVPGAEMKVPESLPKDAAGMNFLYRQLASYFTMVLTEWQAALSRRDDSVKSTSAGKQAYNAMVQARSNMVPLFRKLEKGDLEKGILEPVVEIVRYCQERRYVDANDAYLRLSIGKAAWPIGVTMVGIHERSAREKLHESDKNSAHIMSDETTRKFLQSIKRCLSFAQTRWPPYDQLQLMG